VVEVVALQDLVAELGEAHAVVGLHALLHAVLAEHDAHAEIAADLAQQVDKGERLEPVVVVDQDGRIGGLRVEVDEAREVLFNADEVALDLFRAEEIALFGFSGRIADETGGAADERDDPVARALQMGQRHDGHKVTGLQAVVSGVEARVDGQRRVQRLGQFRAGHVFEQVTGFKGVKDIHGMRCVIE